MYQYIHVAVAAAVLVCPSGKVTMHDGYKYTVMKRYSQFEHLRESVARLLRAFTPPFPPKHGMRSATVGLGHAELEERRCVSGQGRGGGRERCSQMLHTAVRGDRGLAH